MASTKANIDRTTKFLDIMEPRGLNLELLIATEVLGLTSLHYGYWQKGEQITIDNLKTAQSRYTQTLLDMIPKGVVSVLDIGAGIGDNALSLVEREYEVTAISPDVNHKKYFDEYKNVNLTFENCSLQNFNSDKIYDLFLLSESQTYFDPKVTFGKSKTNLKPGGYILISDIFNKIDKITPHAVTHTELQYIQEASESGLELIESVDITEDVLPSMELAYSLFSKYVPPLTSVIAAYIKATAPIKFRLLNFVFQKRIKNISKIINYYHDRLNPQFFTENMVYKRLLFKKI